MGKETAIADDLQEEGGHRLGAQRFARRAVLDVARFEIDRDVVAGTDALRVAADYRREADVDGVAVEEAGERFGDERSDAEMLQRFRRLLARGAGAEVAAGYHHVAFAYARCEGGLHRFQAISRDFVDAVFHVATRRDYVRVHVVAEDPGSHCSMPR